MSFFDYGLPRGGLWGAGPSTSPSPYGTPPIYNPDNGNPASSPWLNDVLRANPASLWNAHEGPPGGGGGSPSGLWSLPDTSGVQQALADNAAQGAQNEARRKQKRERFGYDVGTVLLSALAGLGGGDPVRSGMAIGQARAQRLDDKAQAAQLAQVHAAIDADPNMSPQEKTLAKANIKAYTEQWSQQFGTHNVNAGDTLERGLGGGHRSTFTAPKISEVSPGHDLVLSDPSGAFGFPRLPSSAPTFGQGPAVGGRFPDVTAGQRQPPVAEGDTPQGFRVNGQEMGPNIATPIFSSRTEMERYAEQFGSKGSPEWKAALQDWRLRGAGPTAFIYKDQLQDQRLDQSNTNNIRTTGTSAANNIRTTNTSRDNNVRSTTTSRDNNIRTTSVRERIAGKRVGGKIVTRSEPMATAADGTPLVIRNGKWVPAR